MPEKMWGGEPFWGLGYEWDPDWVLTDRQKELRDLLIELSQKEMRANAKVSDDNLEYPRKNLELLGEHGFLALTVPTEYGGLGEDHVALPDDLRDDRALRLRIDRHVLRDAHGGGQHDHAAAHRRADRQVHPAAGHRQDRDPLLLGPRDRIALLVPDLLQRPALQRRLYGQQEGVVDDLGRVRRLLRGADDQPRLLGLRRPVGVRHRRRGRQGPALHLGRPGPARQPVRAHPGRGRLDPGRARSSVPRATAPPPTTRPSTRGS